MKNSKDLIDQQLKNLRTEAGPQASSSNRGKSRTDSSDRGDSGAGRGPDRVDAINAVFTKLEAAFPLKYRRAFPSVEQENVAKAQWLETLKSYSPARIVRATQKAIETTRFFPDLADIRELCQLKYDEYGLKEPLLAYYEACNAGSQTRDWPWSHLVVYLAAQASGWLLLRGEPQQVAFPIFERNYEILCNRVLNGEDLESEILQGLENQAGRARLRASLAAAEQRQQEQMRDLGVDPEGGRAEFLKMKAQLKSITGVERDHGE